MRCVTTMLLAAVLASAGPVARGDDGSPRSGGASEALSASIEVEKALLKEDRERWARLAQRRDEIAVRAAALSRDLDEMLGAEGKPLSPQIDDLLGRLDDLERERSEVLAQERVILDRVRDRTRRITLLEERVGDLAARAGEAAGPLTATWDLSLMPGGQHGRLFLVQNGTLVSGTYVLDGGFSGSVTGTFVNRKVVLERIDSKLGRWGTFEGLLAADGTRIRGTWSSLELAGREGGSGPWAASRAAGP